MIGERLHTSAAHGQISWIKLSGKHSTGMSRETRVISYSQNALDSQVKPSVPFNLPPFNWRKNFYYNVNVC